RDVPATMASAGRLFRIDLVATNLKAVFSSPTALGGYGLRRCQAWKKAGNRGRTHDAMNANWVTKSSSERLVAHLNSWSASASGAGTALDGAIGTIGVDIERASRPFD